MTKRKYPSRTLEEENGLECKRGATMKCLDCPHFHIVQEPIQASGGGYWDLGMARCDKLSLVVDFASHRKLKRLECEEEKQKQ